MKWINNKKNKWNGPRIPTAKPEQRGCKVCLRVRTRSAMAQGFRPKSKEVSLKWRCVTKRGYEIIASLLSYSSSTPIFFVVVVRSESRFLLVLSCSCWRCVMVDGLRRSQKQSAPRSNDWIPVWIKNGQ